MYACEGASFFISFSYPFYTTNYHLISFYSFNIRRHVLGFGTIAYCYFTDENWLSVTLVGVYYILS